MQRMPRLLSRDFLCDLLRLICLRINSYHVITFDDSHTVTRVLGGASCLPTPSATFLRFHFRFLRLGEVKITILRLRYADVTVAHCASLSFNSSFIFFAPRIALELFPLAFFFLFFSPFKITFTLFCNHCVILY